jgi:hypothetical protein
MAFTKSCTSCKNLALVNFKVMKLLLYTCALFIVVGSACKGTKTAANNPAEIGKADSMILRQICDYCWGEQSVYQPQKFPMGTLCLCYDDFDPIDSLKLENTILQNAATVKHLTIENPSQYIFNIPFDKFTSLQTLYIFGNDFNTDGLEKFPPALLNLKHFKRIIFDGVRFDLAELERIKKQYPHIKIVGEISEYKTH